MDWNDRYAGGDYLFGTEPAAFLRKAAPQLPPASRILCIADGEGRNSVYLARLGHHVTAFDLSDVAVEKAVRLAEAADVTVDFQIAGIDDWDWSEPFDAVVGIFIQFTGPDRRDALFAQMAQAVRPGGHLLLHGYAPRQVGYGTGGPGQAANMYTTDLLRAGFAGWDIRHIDDYDAEIDEGAGHSGRSALVDLVAVRPRP